MTARLKKRPDFEFQHPGFSAFSAKPNTLTGHRHNELEISVSELGDSISLFGGRTMQVPSNRMLVLWGAMPHQPLQVDTTTMSYGIRVPMHWVLQWRLPDALMRRLLNLDVILDVERLSPCSDLDLVKHWVGLMQTGRQGDREIVLLEIHARLLRLAVDTGDSTTDDSSDGARQRPRKTTGPETRGPGMSPAVGIGLLERILQAVEGCYREPARIPQIARELRISREHLMRQFRKATGVTLLRYITDLRVSSAQRLMVTTDMKILDIAYESGFQSPGQFYACFKRATGVSPARYRRSIRR